MPEVTRRISYGFSNRGARTLHIETPLAIYNVTVGLRDRDGNRIERVDVIPNRTASNEPRIVNPDRHDVYAIRLREESESNG